jgi:hypothetical protein
MLNAGADRNTTDAAKPQLSVFFRVEQNVGRQHLDQLITFATSAFLLGVSTAQSAVSSKPCGNGHTPLNGFAAMRVLKNRFERSRLRHYHNHIRSFGQFSQGQIMEHRSSCGCENRKRQCQSGNETVTSTHGFLPPNAELSGRRQRRPVPTLG